MASVAGPKRPNPDPDTGAPTFAAATATNTVAITSSAHSGSSTIALTSNPVLASSSSPLPLPSASRPQTPSSSTPTTFPPTPAHPQPDPTQHLGQNPSLQSHVADDTDDFGVQNYRPVNRGRKLRPRTIEPHGIKVNPLRPSLWAMHSIEEHTKFERIGKKRVISKRGAIGLSPGTSRRDNDDDLGMDGPYSHINIEELWAPIEKTADITRNKAAVHTLRSRQLAAMSAALMEMIESYTAPENGVHRILNRLVDVVFGDDPLVDEAELNWDALGVPKNVIDEFRDVVQACLSASTEQLRYLTMTRSKLAIAYQKKKSLARKLVPHPSKEDNGAGVGGGGNGSFGNGIGGHGQEDDDRPVPASRQDTTDQRERKK
ncbi:hypothetical protein DFJ73DRAFT_831307 [Zopfochytrium polystomum]|nr:hypothetical protein DFJ73DRAFT_831307 [Zopfochytrium polystomum]